MRANELNKTGYTDPSTSMNPTLTRKSTKRVLLIFSGKLGPNQKRLISMFLVALSVQYAVSILCSVLKNIFYFVTWAKLWSLEISFFFYRTSQIFRFQRFWPYFFTEWMVYFSYMIWSNMMILFSGNLSGFWIFLETHQIFIFLHRILTESHNKTHLA